jgi:phosphoglucomutase
VLFWLNILATRRQSVEQIVREHWERFGRNYYARHDYEEVDATSARGLMDALRSRLPSLMGTEIAGERVVLADDFSYRDPVDDSLSTSQGVRIGLESGARIVFRLSGTGTTGATIRLYFEAFERDPARHDRDPQEALALYIAAALALSSLEERTGRTAPSVIT